MTRTALLAGTVPVFRVEDEVQRDLSRDLTRLDIEEDTAGMRRLSARFVAIGRKGDDKAEEQLYLDGKIFDFGKKVKVSIGPPEDERTLFEGLVSAIEADFGEGTPGDVVIRAEDKLMDFRLTRRLKTYKNVSDADLARQIAQAHGIDSDVAADGPTYDVVHQLNMSDLAFLRWRARLLQADVWLLDNKLFFKTRDNRSSPSLTLVKDNHLINIQIRADLAHQRTKVKVSGYDAKARDKIDEEADDSALGGEGQGGRTGPSVLAKAMSGDHFSYRVRDVPLQGSEARAWAKAEMLRRARSFVTATGTTDGTPEMVVGSVLELQQVGAPFEGDNYYVTHVWHSYDTAHGHRTRFEAERATINEAR